MSLEQKQEKQSSDGRPVSTHLGKETLDSRISFQLLLFSKSIYFKTPPIEGQIQFQLIGNHIFKKQQHFSGTDFRLWLSLWF